jgi:hypothetical protein
VRCEVRGPVVLAGMSDGPIEWPQGRAFGGNRALAVYGDLARAVRTELAVSGHRNARGAGDGRGAQPPTHAPTAALLFRKAGDLRSGRGHSPETVPQQLHNREPLLHP